VKFAARKWPDVECHDEVVEALKATVEKKTAALLGNWTPEADDDEDDEDEYGPVPKKAKRVDDDDDD